MEKVIDSNVNINIGIHLFRLLDHLFERLTRKPEMTNINKFC